MSTCNPVYVNTISEVFSPRMRKYVISLNVFKFLIGVSGAPVEETVPVPSPTKVELTCKLDENSNLKNPQVTWKKGSETISHTSKTPNSWTIE